MARTAQLEDSSRGTLRDLIGRHGLREVATLLGVPAGTIARAAAGADLLVTSRTAIRARLEALDAGRTDKAA